MSEQLVNEIKKIINFDIDDSILKSILFDMCRYFDKNFVLDLKMYQDKENIKFNQNQRIQLRKYYYYGEQKYLDFIGITKFPRIHYNDSDVNIVANDFLQRIKIYDKNKIISSLIERFKEVEQKDIRDNSKKWLNYYNNKRNNLFDYSLFILRIDQNDFAKNNYSLDYYYKLINVTYDHLENYRHLIIIIEGKIEDKNQNDITWVVTYKLGIFCENFKQFMGKFTPFKQSSQIDSLRNFLNSRLPNKDLNSEINNFYKSISYGFKFEDCLISDNLSKIVLAYKKIQLDKSLVPCPSCMTTIQSGNSFPEIFLRSYECKNPDCPDRSKSGRGKRFDEFSTYRYFKLHENLDSNKIEQTLYEKWRRDIFSNKNDVYLMILKYYAFNNEVVNTYNCDFINLTDRKIVNKIYDISSIDLSNSVDSYDNLPIVKLLTKVQQNLDFHEGECTLKENTILIKGNSSEKIQDLAYGQIGAVITSPPYYNAREYSQWSNLIFYLIDMMINANAIYNTLDNDSYYLYNIGDIVSEDNVYVKSNMSKKRLQLGFLSAMFFEIIGYKLVGNIIWDKGQVQSKRNSTINLNSGYIKPINCYEHVLILKKGKYSAINMSKISKFSPVIKINCKGINIYKHTAPYPPEMVGLLEPFIKPDKYVLDPFVGSGTTCLWCKNNGYKSIGYELNSEYFELAHEKISRN